LNEIINLMPIAVFIKDAHSRMLIMNKACELQWGVPFAQLYNKTGSEIFPPEQIANFLAADKKIFAEGGVFEIEEQVWNTELQTNRIVHTFKKPVFNAAGQADYLIGLCVDITDTKQQEQALKASEARFRTIIDISPVPMALNDEHGAITFLNTAFVQTFGYDTTDIPTLTDWWPKAYPDPDYRQWVTDTWQATLETAEREHQPFVPQELNIHCKNGTQKTVLASTAAISETFNELHLVVLYDITERKQIENALRNSEHRLKEAERIARLGNWELDFLTNTLSWSDGIFQIFDIDKQQFVTTYDTFLAAIHPDDRDAVNTAYTASLKTHQPYHISHRLIMPDGQIKYVHEQCESYFDFEGKPIRSIGTIQDITERKIMEAELRRSNADLEQFAYAVSHDMRQPLRMISSYLSLLEQAFKNKLDEDTQQFMSFALDGAKRMDAMILSLLDYSRVGRRTEPFSLISSRAVVDEALVFLEPELKASGGQVEVTGQWVELLASRDELTRLLQNLIGNALKYHEENKPPYVEVRAIVTANTFKVAVRDSGIGIDPTQIDRLFKVFSRLQARTRFEGTGVGLALCRKIVEHHGGQIGVESTGEGHGCVFWFELPLIMKELE
jgi:PAS domain S-box-containing protein